MGLFRRLTGLFCAVILLLSMGGVWALWVYWDPPTPIASQGLLGMTGFYYKSEEVLPDDPSQQQNALGFIKYVIYDKKAGLNSKKGNAIVDQLEDANELHSNDTITNTNFKHIFSDTYATAFEFTMKYISQTQMYVYVYLDNDIATAKAKIEAAQDAGETLTVRITTYVTLVERSADGALDWEDMGSAKGTAEVVKDGSYYVVAPDTWMTTEAVSQNEENGGTVILA